MDAKQANKELKNKAFTYFVKDYDAKNKIYTLENPSTNDIKKITKEDFDKLSYEQNNPPKPPLLRTRKKIKKH